MTDEQQAQLEKRQAQLDQLIWQINRDTEAVKMLLYETREHRLRLDPLLAFCLGSLWAATRLVADGPT